MECIIIDDHPLLRSSVASILSDQFPNVVCVEAATVEEALARLQYQCPDIILLDLHLPSMHGSAAIQTIHQLHPNLPILMLSGTGSPQDMQVCIDAGAHGFVNKIEPAHIILAAVKAVLQGDIYAPNGLNDLAASVDKHKIVKGVTARHIDILKEMQLGKRNKEIANALGISEATVKVHCRDIFKLLGVNNRHQAVQVSLSLQLLTL